MIICVNLTPQFMATMKLEMNINFSVPVSCITYEWTVFILTYFQHLVHLIGHLFYCLLSNSLTLAVSSLTALTRYQVRLSGLTDLTPVSSVLTKSGRICSISCAITPNCRPSFFTTAASGLSKSTISSKVLYSKLRTCIWFILSSPILLSTTFFLILISEVVDQLALLYPDKHLHH